MHWQPLEAHLRAHLPEALARLNPPADADELRRFAGELDVPLPEDFVAAWSEHDGESLGEGEYLVPGVTLLPLAAMRDERDVMNALLDGEYAGERNVAPAAGPVRPLFWSRRWIPIAQLNGASEFHCLDLDPPEGGRAGQVIRVSMKLWERAVVAPDLAAYFEGLTARMQGGPEPEEAVAAAVTAAVRPKLTLTPAERRQFAVGIALAAVFWVALYFAFTRRTPPAIGAAVAAWAAWFVGRRLMRRR